MQREVKKTADLYNSYGGREKTPNIRYDFERNPELQHGRQIQTHFQVPGGYTSRAAVTRTEKTPQSKYGGVTINGERYTTGSERERVIPGQFVYSNGKEAQTGEEVNLPDDYWKVHGRDGSFGGHQVFDKNGNTVPIESFNDAEIDALNTVHDTKRREKSAFGGGWYDIRGGRKFKRQ